MEKLKLAEIVRWCKSEVINKSLLKKDCCGISTDTRRIKKGEVFVAIKGARLDGCKFIGEAFKKGAVAAISEKGNKSQNRRLIKVDDAVKALGDIALGYKNMFAPYTIGVTGSDGKTTTKELIKNVLSVRCKTISNEGNFNNAIGLPLSIFNIDRTKEVCVLEMGMNKKGEIDYLSRIARPEAAVITNIGTAHIGHFNSMKAIAEAKSEIMENLSGEKLCILNYDSKFYGFLKNRAPALSISFGKKKGAGTRGIIIKEGKDSFSFAVQGGKEVFHMNFWNTTAIYPALVAYIFSKKFSISAKHLKTVLEGIKPLQGRGLIHKAGKISVIDESYNCNPNSLKWALYNFSRKDFKKKIAVLGDMEELGRLSYILHRNIGIFAKNLDIDAFITFGEKSRAISEMIGKKCRHFEEVDFLNKYLSKIIKGETAVLIKGSRAMKLENTVDYLIRQ